MASPSHGDEGKTLSKVPPRRLSEKELCQMKSRENRSGKDEIKV
jgi:hypothetical protein